MLLTCSGFFLDNLGALGKLERTPQGGYVAPARIARTGVMEYSTAMLRKQGLNLPDDIGPITRVYCPPEVLQAAADTLGTVPVTRDHPPEMVNPRTYSKVTRGSVVSGSVAFDGTYLNSRVALQDEGLIADVDLGARREISMGYFAKTRVEKGVSPEGETYDAIREEIVYNHLAVLKAGRAGSKVCLALDSAEIPYEEDNTVKLKIKGVEVDVTQANIDALEGEIAALQAQLSTVQTEAKEAKDALTVATSDSALDARIEAKLAADAKKAKLSADRKRAAEAYPTLNLDAKDEKGEYVHSDGHISGICATLDDPDGQARLEGRVGARKTPKTEEVADARPRESAKERNRKRNAELYKAPLKG